MTVTALGEVRRAIESMEQDGVRVILDLGELTLLDRHSAEFLSSQSEQGIDLIGCPLYLRRWIVPTGTPVETGV